MECLVNFSTWVETNSGQIQIGIGIIALALAFLGYKKVLEQMKLAESIKKKDAKLNFTRLFNEMNQYINDFSFSILELEDFIKDVEAYELSSNDQKNVDKLKEILEKSKNSLKKVKLEIKTLDENKQEFSPEHIEKCEAGITTAFQSVVKVNNGFKIGRYEILKLKKKYQKDES